MKLPGLGLHGLCPRSWGTEAPALPLPANEKRKTLPEGREPDAPQACFQLWLALALTRRLAMCGQAGPYRKPV